MFVYLEKERVLIVSKEVFVHLEIERVLIVFKRSACVLRKREGVDRLQNKCLYT